MLILVVEYVSITQNNQNVNKTQQTPNPTITNAVLQVGTDLADVGVGEISITSAR
jgi:hypothetical protein